jgi:tetratricopeptide (TPR) repeat protein
MKIFVPVLITAAVGLSLGAQTTGSLQGKVLDSKGKPVPSAKVTVSKLGINWTKELKVNSDGKFFQVGFTPGDYKIAVSAEGFVGTEMQDHIGVGLVLQKDIVLLTPQEAVKSGKATAAVDPSAAAEAKGLDSYNQAVGFFNEKKFAEALPLFESASKDLSESLAKTTDATAKAETEKKLATVERPFAFTLMEVAKTDEAKKAELMAKAEPMLLKIFERNPKDQNAIVYLLDLASAKQDAEGIKNYQAALDALLGPRPELAYNQGVELYNAGKLAEAKPFLQKAIGIKAEFAEAYYLLAMCEFAEMNLKGTKVNLQKYLQLDPAGKHAAEVKAMLADPSLKNVK